MSCFCASFRAGRRSLLLAVGPLFYLPMEDRTIDELIDLHRAGKGCELEIWQRSAWMIDKEARAYLARWDLTPSRVDREDLMQAGYLATLEALADYDPAKGFSFYTYLKNHLKTQFYIATNGSRSRAAAYDAANHAESLDVSVLEDGDGPPLVEEIPDPATPYEEADERIYIQELHAALEDALARLPARKADAIRKKYFEGLTLQEIAAEDGKAWQGVSQRIKDGLRDLRRSAHKTGLDVYARQNYYTGAGLGSFRRTWTSSTERIAIKAAEESAEIRLFRETVEELEARTRKALQKAE